MASEIIGMQTIRKGMKEILKMVRKKAYGLFGTKMVG